MGILIPIAVVSGFWAVVLVVGPLLVCRGPNQGIIRTMIVMTAVCCWAFWMLIYIHQMNPLIGPQLDVKIIRWIDEQWGNTHTPPTN